MALAPKDVILQGAAADAIVATATPDRQRSVGEANDDVVAFSPYQNSDDGVLLVRDDRGYFAKTLWRRRAHAAAAGGRAALRRRLLGRGRLRTLLI